MLLVGTPPGMTAREGDNAFPGVVLSGYHCSTCALRAIMDPRCGVEGLLSEQERIANDLAPKANA